MLNGLTMLFEELKVVLGNVFILPKSRLGDGKLVM